jgi:D-sedoheptulose 7-phosphate isomerase
MTADRAALARSLTDQAIADHLETARALPALAGDIARAGEMAAEALIGGGKLLFCGNGGSAADAQHLAAEFTGRFLKERSPLPALALHGNSSGVTAIGNDYGFDRVFARQVEAFAAPGDLLVGITTSGNSANVLRAAEAARAAGAKVLALTGGVGVPVSCAGVPDGVTSRWGTWVGAPC